ncbi:DNA binding protein [Mycobacterium phage Suarez]|nr:DNA binding protein [Mycobacterium phage Suarez]
MTTPVRKPNTGIAELAIHHLMRGQRVLYVGLAVRDMLRDIAETMSPNLLKKVYLSRGDEAIETSTGGRINFCSPRQSGLRGRTADVLILDGVSDAVAELAMPCVAGSDIGHVHRYPPKGCAAQWCDSAELDDCRCTMAEGHPGRHKCSCGSRKADD